MTLEEITTGLAERIGEDCGLGATLKFDFGDDGVIHLDATVVPNVVSNDDQDAQCTLKMTLEDFIAMRNGEMDGMVRHCIVL